MDNLSEYFSQQDKIKELEMTVAKLETTIKTLRVSRSKYKKLETTVKTLRVSRSKYKKLYRDAADIKKPPTRTELVLEVLHKVKRGEIQLNFHEIAKKFHVSIHYVYELSSNINKELADQG